MASEAPMEKELDQDSFDVVILGTGIVESIVAAAVARAGKSVLHLDPAACYGCEMREMRVDCGAGPDAPPVSVSGLPANVPVEVCVRGARINDDNICPGDACIVDRSRCLLEGLTGTAGSRLVCSIDACPQVALASGAFISLLVSCGAHQYVDWKDLDGGCLLLDGRSGELLRVPASRGDVFRDDRLSALEKNRLYKFIKGCVDRHEEEKPATTPGRPVGMEESDSNDGEGSDGRTFADEMRRHRLGATLQAMAQHVIGMSLGASDAEALSMNEGCERVHAYVTSIDKFGVPHGAFLYPLYGTGELPQAFCRSAAVDGALYVLRRGVRLLHRSEMAGGPGGSGEGRCTAATLSTGQRINIRQGLVVNGNMVDNLVLESSFTSRDEGSAEPQRTASKRRSGRRWVSHCIALTPRSKSIVPEYENALIVVPPRDPGKGSSGARDAAVHALQLGPSMMMFPESVSAVHFTAASEGEDNDDDDQEGGDAQTDASGTMQDQRDGRRASAARRDLEPTVASLYGGSLENVDVAIFYQHAYGEPSSSEGDGSCAVTEYFENVYTCAAPGPGLMTNLDHAVARARAIFDRLCPGSSFCEGRRAADMDCGGEAAGDAVRSEPTEGGGERPSDCPEETDEGVPPAPRPPQQHGSADDEEDDDEIAMDMELLTRALEGTKPVASKST